jgi:hypothetical protein
MGSTDLAAMRRGEMDRSGEGTTRAGMIVGIIGTIGWIVVVFLRFTLLGVGMRRF